MKDFFVSYTEVDEEYATWVAELLEAEQYSVTIQVWDFRPGDNFVSKINKSLAECKQLIVILSENYLKSKWCEAEWTVKLEEQICLNEQRIIPIRIQPINLEGLLSPIVYIDIVGKTETEARKEILNGVRTKIERKSAGYPSYYNVEHLKIDNDYFVNDTVIVYQKLCKTKFLKNGFNKLHNGITWFPDEQISLVSLTEGVKIEYLDLKDTYLNYNVIFDHKIGENEEIEYCIQATLTNNNHYFKNFFSTEIIVPIKQLNIHLNIFNPCTKKYYTQKISSSPMNMRTEDPQEHVLYSPVHWYIQNPELNFEYKIFW